MIGRASPVAGGMSDQSYTPSTTLVVIAYEPGLVDRRYGCHAVG